ncbi:hypothetical protein OG689_27070 [Kitasatospora sp. NBC_00240]|uniref:hypothetical protein n=1 Tax=Kitasatospora sp. NBC_00240 TaxID=2903567 RepID=UPI002256B4D7|nr:hypothetical protein [Kitasatospora sp. NBC_00240]MCX5212892.1 hypothetical protein [Kitasatospora sp. NBC_00240]
MRVARGARGRVGVMMAAVVVPVAAGLSLAAVKTLRDGPPGTTLLVALLTFAMAMTAGVSVCEPVYGWSDAVTDGEAGAVDREERDRHTRAVAGLRRWCGGCEAGGTTGCGGPVRAGRTGEAPADVGRGEPGRCFGCVRLQEVTEVGVLAREGVHVPVRVCDDCLAHLEAWHIAQVAGARA